MNYLQEQKHISLLFLLIASSLVFAWILELGFEMEPCSLCLLQRFGLYVSLGFLLLYLTVNYWKKHIIINTFLNLGSLTGLIFSLVSGGKQVHLQSLPADQIPTCGADLNTLLEIATPLQAVKKVFEGSGDCADKAFVFLNLSLAGWATILFSLFVLYQLYIIVKEFKK